MRTRQGLSLRSRISRASDSWPLPVVFGVAAVPWTYAFVAGLGIPLWPSFVASATYFAVDDGFAGLVRGYASNFVGIVYAAATLAVVDGYLGGGVIALSLVVGVGMCLASLHDLVPLLSYVPGGFFGYATMFGVASAGDAALGVTGLPGLFLAAVASTVVGAVIAFAVDETSRAIDAR